MSTRQPSHPPQPASPQRPTDGDSWRPKTLEELAAEQGVGPVSRAEDLLGCGDDLWADDAEFEQFLAWLRDSRRAGG
jgi:hypothetical protein